MITAEWAASFAHEWVAAWNSGDLDRIFSHYADDFSMSSPLIRDRFGEPSGTLHGKDAIRPYWQAGLAVQPPLHFELIHVYAGANDIAIQYHSKTRGKIVIEWIEFGGDMKGIRASALYRDATDELI